MKKTNDPLNYEYVEPVKKMFTKGLVRMYQYSPASFAYVKKTDQKNKEEVERNLEIVEQDRNRAIEMAVDSASKANPASTLKEIIYPMIGIGSSIGILILLFLLFDRGATMMGTFQSAAEIMKEAIAASNKCQVLPGP